jgi:DNA polymerase-3 subunit alpha
MAILTIEDITGTVSAVLFPRTWEKFRGIVSEDSVLIVSGKADTSRGDMQVVAESVTQDFEVAAAADEKPRLDHLHLPWMDEDVPEAGAERLSSPPDEPTGEIAADHTAQAEAEPATEAPRSTPAPSRPRRASGPLTDREMPGWLEAELNNGWTPPPDFTYADDTGHIIGIEQPEQTGTPPAFDAAGRLSPPPARAARPRDETDEAGPPAPRLPRRPPPKAEPEPDAQPGRLLVLTLRRSGDAAQDQRRMAKLHGFLTQYPGTDHFCFIIEGAGMKTVRINYPKYPIEINDEVLTFARDYLGEEHVRIE